MTTKLNRIKSALRESIELADKATEGPWHTDSARGVILENSSALTYPFGTHESEVNDATFIAHARTMTPLACKALLKAIERLELGLKCQETNEGLWAFSFNTLESITSEWPNA